MDERTRKSTAPQSHGAAHSTDRSAPAPPMVQVTRCASSTAQRRQRSDVGVASASASSTDVGLIKFLMRHRGESARSDDRPRGFHNPADAIRPGMPWRSSPPRSGPAATTTRSITASAAITPPAPAGGQTSSRRSHRCGPPVSRATGRRAKLGRYRFHAAAVKPARRSGARALARPSSSETARAQYDLC